ncbi:MAG: hypothetical protein O2789_05250 [Actinomycetota bacterium]|nr:hypothetical protein [Actinomycetota bacterium]
MRRSTIALATVALSSALALTGCGGSDSAPEPAPTVTEMPEDSTGDAPDEMTDGMTDDVMGEGVTGDEDVEPNPASPEIADGITGEGVTVENLTVDENGDTSMDSLTVEDGGTVTFE